VETTDTAQVLATIEAEVLEPLRARIRAVLRCVANPSKGNLRKSLYEGTGLLPTSPAGNLLRYTLEFAACRQAVREAVSRGDMVGAVRHASAAGEAVAYAEHTQDRAFLNRYFHQSLTASANRQTKLDADSMAQHGWGILAITPEAVAARLWEHHCNPKHAGDSYHRACRVLADELGVGITTVKEASAKGRDDTRRMW